MKKLGKGISVLLSIILVFAMVLPVSAADSKSTARSSGEVITGTYQYTSNEGRNIQQTDTFVYRDACFTQSSFENDTHLEVLSSQLALSSSSWYGQALDPYEKNPSENAHNVIDFLEEMQFEDVSTNKYYTLEKEANSVGVCVGHKTITVNGKDYTLLAIVPRSAGYKEEWAGNFTVNDGDIHYGFKAARDEILRYVKQYIEDNDINGNIKVWTCGHSRGAALANLVGGFFAGGGIEYFDGSVNITPQDVYCYTYATPGTVKICASRKQVLSVEGNREEDRYANDTPGEAWSYPDGGVFAVYDDEFKGIKNFILDSDVIAKLPPEAWDFARFGQDIDATHGLVSDEQAAEKLATVCPYAYNMFVANNGVRTYTLNTFDLAGLALVDVEPSGTISANEFLNERISGLVTMAGESEVYANEGWQDALVSLAGIYGLTQTYLYYGKVDYNKLIKPVAFSYIVYASEDLIESGVAADENEAAAFVIEDLLAYLTGDEIGHSATVDDLIAEIGKYVCDHEDSVLVKTLIEKIAGLELEEMVKSALINIFDAYNPNADPESKNINPVSVKEFFKAMYNGALEGSLVNKNGDKGSPGEARAYLYSALYLASALSESLPDFKQVIDISTNPVSAPAPASKLVEIFRPILLTEKDKDGNIIHDYKTFAEAADGVFRDALDKVFEPIYADYLEQYGEAYTAKLQGYVESAKLNITQLRQLIMEFLFHIDGERTAASDVETISTLVANAARVGLSHYNELYVAYAKAYADTVEEYPNHGIPVEADKKDIEVTSDMISDILAAFDKDPALEEEGAYVILNMVDDIGLVATVAPVELLEMIQGRNIDLVLDMGEYTWTINGKDITATDLQAINLEVTFDNNIPDEKIKKLAGDKPIKKLSLTYDGEFGFKATLKVDMGVEYAGKNGMLYWDNNGVLTHVNTGYIDENGIVALEFTHASDYIIVVNDIPVPPTPPTPVPNDTPSSTTPQTPQTGDASNLNASIVMVIIGCFAVTATIVVRKRKYNQN